ncbi:hypothetical protein C5B93_01090 [Rathayibacter sp. AY1A2]|uniref:hypothetical protein n=1 Tax=Rathayibacter sp. AY1A2 TaxID=2080520 RepID=UPI000CE7B831|nr:hypothetical protein [Rathayibacter sp. AY1A2]PPF41337.1 hypothetical protein C5B93_01090 [Rathayibacter sp. AY1A2]
MADDIDPSSGPLGKAFGSPGASFGERLAARLAENGALKFPLPGDLLEPDRVAERLSKIPYEIDQSPKRTADNTAAMTQHLSALTEVMREQAELVAQQVALSKDTLATAEQAERRANRIGWISLAVAAASLGTSIGALFIVG